MSITSTFFDTSKTKGKECNTQGCLYNKIRNKNNEIGIISLARQGYTA